MKKKYLLFLYVCFPLISSYSQIGINTFNPQQAVHVSGEVTDFDTAPTVGTTLVKIIEPTVRVEGLNSTNNSAHTSDENSLHKVYVSKDGDLMLRKGNSNFLLVNEIGTIEEASAGIPTTGLNTTIATVLLKSIDFNVIKESIVNISAAITGEILNYVVKNNDYLNLQNDTEQHFGFHFIFEEVPAGSEELLDQKFAETSFKLLTTQAFIQRTQTTLYSNKNLLLNPGNYRINIIGFYSGRRDKKATFGIDNTNEFVKIIAIPTNNK